MVLSALKRAHGSDALAMPSEVGAKPMRLRAGLTAFATTTA